MGFSFRYISKINTKIYIENGLLVIYQLKGRLGVRQYHLNRIKMLLLVENKLLVQDAKSEKIDSAFICTM